VATLFRTKREVDARVLAGISETHDSKEDGRTVEVIDAGDGVSLKIPRGRQRETTSLFSQVTDDGRHKFFQTWSHWRSGPAKGQICTCNL